MNSQGHVTTQLPIPQGLVCFAFLLPAEMAEDGFQLKSAHALWILDPLTSYPLYSHPPSSTPCPRDQGEGL